MNNNVGELTASEKLKSAFRKAGLVNVSLKAFARLVIKEDDKELAPVAKQWLKNKSAAGRTKRSDANSNLAKTIGAAVKMARRAKSSKK